MSDNEEYAYCEKSMKERIASTRSTASKLENYAAKSNAENGEIKYYSLKEAIVEIEEAEGAIQTTIAGGKFIGKLGVNMSKFTIKKALPTAAGVTALVLEELAKANEKRMKENE